MSDDYIWTLADRISNEIVTLVNSHIKELRGNGRLTGSGCALQLLVGQLLALKALDESMPANKPATLTAFMQALDNVLADILWDAVRQRSNGE